MEPIDSKSNLSNKPIVGMIVIVVVALFIGGWLYVDSVRGELEMKVEAVASQASLSQATAGKAIVKAEALEEASIPGGAAGVYRIGDYFFEAKSGMTLDRFDQSSGMLMDGALAVALFQCPSPDTGFEGWEFKDQKRSLTAADGAAVQVTFRQGSPIPGEGSGDLSVIQVVPESKYLAKTSLDCLITSWDQDPSVHEHMKDIYNTLSYHSER